ncbi:MAG: hypothetical protein H7337_15690 [Rhizobacter sp.]|nr:hypothetical protein [Rhizobacter sp.]
MKFMVPLEPQWASARPRLCESHAASRQAGAHAEQQHRSPERKLLEQRITHHAYKIECTNTGDRDAVKDNVDVVGLPTDAGCPSFASGPAPRRSC